MPRAAISGGRPSHHPGHWTYPLPGVWIPATKLAKAQILATLEYSGGAVEDESGHAIRELWRLCPWAESITQNNVQRICSSELTGVVEASSISPTDGKLKSKRTFSIRLVGEVPPDLREFVDLAKERLAELQSTGAAEPPPEPVAPALEPEQPELGSGDLPSILRAIAAVLEMPVAEPELTPDDQDTARVSHLEERLYQQTELYNAERRKRIEADEANAQLRRQLTNQASENRKLMEANEGLVRNLRGGRVGYNGQTRKIIDLMDDKSRRDLERLMRAIPHVGKEG